MNYRTKTLGLLAVCTLLLPACGGGDLRSSGAATGAISFTDGATGVALDAPVTVLFSAAITDPASWSSSFTLKKDNAGDNLCTTVTYDRATLTATCTHANFDRASSYTVGVSGLEDIGGLNIAAASAAFATKLSVVISSIKLVRLDSTELDLTDLPIPRSATIKYVLATALTEGADRTAFEAAITVTDAAAAEVAGTHAWAADYLSVVFTPSSKLGYRTVYTIAVDDGSLPVAGLSMNVSAEQTFTTMTYRDIDGNGYADAVMGAYQAPYDTLNGVAGPGSAYVFLSSGLGGIADCNPVAAACISTPLAGVQNADQFGFSVDLADVNADGYEDLMVGAVGVPDGLANGAMYVYHGSASGISTTVNTMIGGESPDDLFGWSVSTAGDVNNDGFDDAIVGATQTPDQDTPGQGRAYVFLGSVSGIASCTVGEEGCAYATISGAVESDILGTSVSTAGDVDNDRFDDVIVGAPFAELLRGQAYVFLGSSLSEAMTPAYAAITITGENSFDMLGSSVSTAGDVNGDGFDDIILGATFAPADMDDFYLGPGQAYVLLSSETVIPNCTIGVDCPSLNATLTGEAEQDGFGYSVSTAGDVNNDGLDDVIVGASLAHFVGNDPGPGKAYVFLSDGAGGIPTCDMSDACHADAAITGTDDDDRLGNMVSDLGYVDDDEYADLIVGAFSQPLPAPLWGPLKGGAYIFLGSALSEEMTPVDAATTFTGTAVGDQLGAVR